MGIGILKEVSQRKVKIYFPLSDETRVYAMESAPLRRVVFKPGDTIEDINQQTVLIERVELENGLYVYYGNDKKMSEAELGDVSVHYGVVDRLFLGDVDTPHAFALRRETLQHEYNRRTSPVYGFVGGRIDLIPHQLYIAHEVSSRYAPRVLLSDQVGLGKTIEACLIIHRLLLSERISRVLIIVPESLIHQWFVELLRRFNMWFHIFDEERCASLDDSAIDGNPFLDDQLILCSIEFLAGSDKRSSQARAANWDMLVVDEAHHLEWSVDEVSPEYCVVEQLSHVAKGLLLLTATPEQLGLESHFARLRLLDPNRYSNYDDFTQASSDDKITADIVEKLHSGKDLDANDVKVLESWFPKERIQSVRKGGDKSKENLIEDLLDQYGPGRVIFRNTRSAMRGFPKRKAHPIPLRAKKDHNEWVERLTKEFVYDMKSGDSSIEQEFLFKKDPRVRWLLTTLREIHPAKALLICKSKEKVLALEAVLAKRAKLKVGVFHEDLTIVQRDKNAAWFTEPDGAQILLCSEIGSEGRNFQFTHHLILFDLPSHPELLEQRIGRLDRIGQTKEIQIYIPYLVHSPQHQLVRWYHEGMNAFEKNLEGGHKIFKKFGDRLLNLSFSPPPANNDSELEALITETSTYHQDLQKSLADGRDRLMEMNSFRPKVARELIEQIQKEDNDHSLERYCTKVFRHFDIEMEDLPSRTYFLHPASVTTEAFPTIPSEGIYVTFDRNQALSREDIRFLSWDHPMTTACIDRVLSSGTGSASFGVLRGSNTLGLLMEFLFMLETSKKQGVSIGRFLPNTPLRMVVDHAGQDVTDRYPIETFDKKLTSGPIAPLLDNETMAETILPKMISAATIFAEEQGSIVRATGLQRMNRTLNHEIDQLKALQKNNKNIRPEEIQTATEEQILLASLIENARVRLDAVQLIRME